MNREKILIEENPLEEILRSTSETLYRKTNRKKECFVYLFGNTPINNYRWVVESAHAVQLVDRYPGSIKCFEEDLARAKFCLKNKFIGDYHSHVPSIVQKNGEKKEIAGVVGLSKTDQENLANNIDKINLIAGVNEVFLKRKLTNNNSILLSGYLEVEGITYKIDMGGYYFDNRIKRAIIEAPKSILKLIQ